MTLQAQSVEYILTESPIQALIWENDLVRKEQPRFNTKLRDDKHYPYVRIDVQNPWPVARVSRRIEKDGARYFGPFPHATSVRQTLDTLSRLFPQILCSRTITGNDPRACLYYHIKRCPAPCIGAIDNRGVPRAGRRHGPLPGRQELVGPARTSSARWTRRPRTSSSSGRPTCEIGCARPAR